MKSKKQIQKMLEGYIVGRPKSRNRKFGAFQLLLFCEWRVTTVYAVHEVHGQVFKKEFFGSWFDAFEYYYNTLETKIKKLEAYELYKGAEIIVDYNAQNNQDIIDHFEETSNFEGHAELESIDIEAGEFTIKGFPLDTLSVEYLIVLNQHTNEYEYFEN